ncbi:MAG: hypothetical protein AAF436_00690 [Myxococcota bacterium]
MAEPNRRVVLGIALAVLTVALGFGVGMSFRQEPEVETWQPELEGFLAVATPCCTEASLVANLEQPMADDQRARPATALEAAAWVDTWPYRKVGEDAPAKMPPVSLNSSEVRCVGAPTGPDVPRDGDDTATIDALRQRHECTYARWRVWRTDTPHTRPNERHTVWADEDGQFHGRIDYWRAE